MLTKISLEQMRIASPCDVGWNQMDGDDRSRFCHQCQKHVYDLTQMSQEEMIDLVTRTEGKFCGRLYQRIDDRVLTADCPIGLRRARRAVRRVARHALTRMAAAILVVLGWFGYGIVEASTHADAWSVIHDNRIFRTLDRWAHGRYLIAGAMSGPQYPELEK